MLIFLKHKLKVISLKIFAMYALAKASTLKLIKMQEWIQVYKN